MEASIYWVADIYSNWGAAIHWAAAIFWVAGPSRGEWSLAVGQLQLGPNSGRSMCTLEQSNTGLSCRPSQGELVLLSGIAPGASCLVQYLDSSCLVQYQAPVWCNTKRHLLSGVAPGADCLVQYQDSSCLVLHLVPPVWCNTKLLSGAIPRQLLSGAIPRQLLSGTITGDTSCLVQYQAPVWCNTKRQLLGVPQMHFS